MKKLNHRALSLTRQTVRTLASAELAPVAGGMIDRTYTCPSRGCGSVTNTQCTSCPSCGDCGLEKP